VDELKQPSTHLARKQSRSTDKLEQDLEDWAVWVLMDIGLFTPCKTSLKVAEELRPEQIKNKPPKTGDLYTTTNNSGKVVPRPAWQRQQYYDIENMFRKTNVRSSQSVKSPTPLYYTHRRLSRLNKAIGMLEEEDKNLWWVIIVRYREKKDWRDINVPKSTFFDTLKRAKKRIKQLATNI